MSLRRVRPPGAGPSPESSRFGSRLSADHKPKLKYNTKNYRKQKTAEPREQPSTLQETRDESDFTITGRNHETSGARSEPDDTTSSPWPRTTTTTSTLSAPRRARASPTARRPCPRPAPPGTLRIPSRETGAGTAARPQTVTAPPVPRAKTPPWTTRPTMEGKKNRASPRAATAERERRRFG